MPQPIRFPHSLLGSLGLDPRVPTGAVVQRRNQLAEVIAPLSLQSLLVLDADGRRSCWPLEESGKQCELYALPVIPQVTARTRSAELPEVQVRVILVNAPSAFFVQLHDAGWVVDLENRTALAQEVLNLCALDVDRVRSLVFDQAEVLDWLSLYRRGIWAHLVCHQAGVQVPEASVAQPSWFWRYGEKRRARTRFSTRVEAELNAAEELAPQLAL